MIAHTNRLVDPIALSGVAPGGRTLTRELDAAAGSRAPAIYTGRDWRSWADVRREARRAAVAMRSLGVERGDVVATHLPSCWELLVVHVATSLLGAVWLPVPMTAETRERNALLIRASPVLLVIRPSYRGRDQMEQGREALEAVDSLQHLASWNETVAAPAGVLDFPSLFLPSDAPPDPLAAVASTDPLVVMASSGTTTMRPKLCVHTHALLDNAATVADDAGFGGADIVVTAVPLTHAFGLLAAHLALVRRARLGWIDAWDPTRFLELLSTSRGTTVFAVPAQLRDLLDLRDRGAALPPLREIRTGGTAVPPDLVRRLEAAFGARVTVQWGMTEVGAGTYTRPGDPPDVLGTTIGRPCTGGRARVIGPDGAEAPPGKVGELEYLSPFLFRGYLGEVALTCAAFSGDGWLRTGDLASATRDGTLRFHGRCDEQINRGGLKYSATEVEGLLSDLPALSQFADRRPAGRSAGTARLPRRRAATRRRPQPRGCDRPPERPRGGSLQVAGAARGRRIASDGGQREDRARAPRRAAAMSGPAVLVVGAGPTGLSAAVALRARGMTATVLEASAAGQRARGTRAVYVHGETLRRLEQISPGLGFTLAADGLVWPTKRTYWGAREVHVRRYARPAAEALPPFTSLPQARTERHLLDACSAAGIEVAWSRPVTDLMSTATGVELTTAGGETYRADYVVGADGAHSAVRKALGVELRGGRSAHSYVVVDLAADDAMPVERVFHYRHPGAGGRNILRVPFSGGWRVDLQCRAGDDPERLARGDGLRRWLHGVLPSSSCADQITWASTYRFAQLVADRFTDPHGRVLLAGDAAHLFAPFGARGLNSGVADATAAAEAIARGASQEFARRRRATACHHRDAAGAALRHIHALDLRIRLKRGTAAQLARWSPSAGAWLDAGPYGPRTSASSTGLY